MTKPTFDFEWPESLSDDDFVARVSSLSRSNRARKRQGSNITVSRKQKPNEKASSKAMRVPVEKRVSHQPNGSSDDDEDIVSTIASKKANAIVLPPGIRSVSDLKWWCEDSVYYPCRICDVMEGTHINLDPVWDTAELALIQVLEYPPTKPFQGRDRILANTGDLKAYGTGDSWDTNIWRKYTRQRALEARRANQKVLSETDVRAGYLYLNRILKAAKAKCCIPGPKCAATADHDDNSDLETPYEVNLELPTTISRFPHQGGMTEFSDKIHEPLRPGDVIQYSSPIFCAGDPRGSRTAMVVSTDPESKGYMVRLDNTEMLPNEHRVKRIRVMEHGKQYAHSGFYRPINRFVLKKRALDIDMRQLYLIKSEEVGMIVDKNIAIFRNSMKGKGVPTDFVPDFKSRQKLKADELLHVAMERRQETKKCKHQVDRTHSNVHEADSTSPTMSQGTKRKRAITIKSEQGSCDSDSDDSLDIVSNLKLTGPTSTKKSGSPTSLINRSNVLHATSGPLPRLRTTKPALSTLSETITNSRSPNQSTSQSPIRKKLSNLVAAIINEDSPVLRKTRHAMIHDESDSDSSIENYGLDTAVKEKRRKSLEKLDTLIPSHETDFPRHVESSSERRAFHQKPLKPITMNHNDGKMASSQNLCHFDQPENETFALAKANSGAERSSRHQEIPSITWDKKSNATRYMTKYIEPSFDVSSSYGGARADRGQTFQDESVVPSVHQLSEKGELTTKHCFQHLDRIKKKGRYFVEEDDIEDSEYDAWRSWQTPRSKKCGNFKPMLQLSSRKEKKGVSSLESHR